MRVAIAAVLLSFLLFSEGCATRVAIAGPPPVRVEVRGLAPSPMHVWDPGHWVRVRGDWEWAPGHWIVAPRRGAEWVPGRWAHRRGEWVWIEGHWRR